jgi:hypothetical protein
MNKLRLALRKKEFARFPLTRVGIGGSIPLAPTFPSSYPRRGTRKNARASAAFAMRRSQTRFASAAQSWSR